ncbi:MAG: hypothetical protein ABSA76_06505 [Bacteroidales bacterium]
MKKKLIFIAALVFIACAFTSCTKTCKNCKQVVYINGSYDHDASSEQEYCGAELTAIELTKDVTIGNTTTKWECD